MKIPKMGQSGEGKYKGLFITFEGFEGSGKSTQIKLLSDFLKKKDYPVLVLREPGSTKIGEQIRQILLNKDNASLSQTAELLLYLACRAQMAQEKIIPALKKGMVVLCDRFQDSTAAYQGFGLGIDRKTISLLGELATLGIRPQLTILLDIGVREGLERIRRDKDRIERRSLDYHRRVRAGYLKIARDEPRRIKIVRVRTIKETQEEIRRLAEEFLRCRLKM